MSQIIELASSQINAGDSIVVELVEADETPTVVIVRWPAKPTVVHPRRFPIAAHAAGHIGGVGAVLELVKEPARDPPPDRSSGGHPARIQTVDFRQSSPVFPLDSVAQLDPSSLRHAVPESTHLAATVRGRHESSPSIRISCSRLPWGPQ